MEKYSLLDTNPYLVAAFILLPSFLFLSLLPTGVYRHFQHVGGILVEWRAVPTLVQDGYDKIIKGHTRPFVVNWWAKDYIILPPKYLADLKTAGWSHLSFFQNINDALFLGHTAGELYTAPAAERMVNVVKAGLNPQLPNLTPLMLDEIEYAFTHQLGEFEGWKEVTAMSFFSSIAHRLATRFLIDEELCRDEKFLEVTQSFLNSIFITALVIVKLPLGPFRRLFVWPLSRMQVWKKLQCAQILLPLVKSRMVARKEGAGKKLDAIEWTLELLSAEKRCNTPEYITEELLYGLWAGSSAPGGMLTEILYQLLLSPQYLTPLREEAEGAVRQHGWSEKMLNDLLLLDSFIREVNRLYPTGSVTCSRTVTGTPFKFSDGLELPVGARFGFPIKAMQSDPDMFTDPMAFDGFRFAQEGLSKDAKDSSHNDNPTKRAKLGATAMGTTNLAWGYGNHVCPGRFFAVREMKIVFAKLLIGFDVKWKNSSGRRPKPVHVEGQFIPNMSQKILLRRRRD
ncbi:hypothetical protein OCU04_000183 [Sclerotinia nivalis]|uniref:Cytochrome P450 n=1 Tax=Sclerotinia nivalis TaxID=352851 RepID=A0A9X0AVK6_9HELO|nr:hypothetical protein OCU04_000183 [Sclerotinia nivalis]